MTVATYDATRVRDIENKHMNSMKAVNGYNKMLASAEKETTFNEVNLCIRSKSGYRGASWMGRDERPSLLP